MDDLPFSVSYETVQGFPLRVKVLGVAVLPVWVAWKPMVVEEPGANVAL
jgi:hypothetical protein